MFADAQFVNLEKIATEISTYQHTALVRFATSVRVSIHQFGYLFSVVKNSLQPLIILQTNPFNCLLISS